jgi:uncharacterized lipoprotein
MRRVRASKLGWAIVLLATTACSWINRPIVYEDARETAPLVVPAGLSRPAANPALQIPAIGASAGTVDPAPPSIGQAVGSPRGGSPRASAEVIRVIDEVPSVYRRVGLALERSACCRVLARDETALRFEVELIEQREKPGFFARWFGGKDPAPTMTVQLAAAGDGVDVRVIDSSGATRSDPLALRVLGAIEARLR